MFVFWFIFGFVVGAIVARRYVLADVERWMRSLDPEILRAVLVDSGVMQEDE